MVGSISTENLLYRMTFSLQTILPLLILFQAIFFTTFLVISNQGKKSSNLLLSLLLLLIGTQMSGFILFDIGYSQLTINYNCAFGFTYGVLLYLYTKSLIYNDFKFSGIDLIHFIPFIIIIILATAKLKICESKIYFLYTFSIVIYVILSFKEIDRYRIVLKQTQSDFDRQNLNWLKLTLNLSVFVFAADFIQFFSNLISFSPLTQKIFEILAFVLLLIFISLIVFKGLMQPEIFSGINKEDQELVKQDIKYASSSLSDSESKASLTKLENYMSTNKPFLESSLNLIDLANILDITPRHLSQIINTKKKQNFLDYVNSKRIEEAMKLLEFSKDEKQTIQEVMYSVGFNSKSAFHYAFKKKTGLTPTEFKRRK